MSNIIQKKIDKIWQNTLFRFLPKKVTPNYFTAVRFILIPVILYFIAIQYFWWAFIFFIISALTDTIDGSLARVRKQITPLGKFLDPIADKLLIILILLIAALYYANPMIILITVLFDVVALLSGLLIIISRRIKIPKVNWLGKIKTLFEVISVLLILVVLASGSHILLLVSLVVLLITMALSFLSLVVYLLISFWEAIK